MSHDYSDIASLDEMKELAFIVVDLSLGCSVLESNDMSALELAVPA